jgi:hypothetical protein
MRLLKAQNTNLRNIYGKGVKYDVNEQVILDSTNVVLVPKGTTAQRPSTPINGHLRYNTNIEAFEVYEDGAWYELSTRAPAGVGGNAPITQQNLGNGDDTSTLFGPLNSGDTRYPLPAAAQNILVFVENVFQISTTNYGLVQNPSSTGTGQEVAADSLIQDIEYIITSPGDTDFTLLGAADNNQGTVFTKNATVGSGTGLARRTGTYIEFTSAPPSLGSGGGSVPITVLHNFDK